MKWILSDYKNNSVRFILECGAWFLSILAACLLAYGTGLKYVYPCWIVGSALYLFCAYSRQSFGMAANYFLLFIIDTLGLFRIILAE